ncbi:polysaccharide biosynthesis/export family protein [Phenylobacterium sp.]|jgi:protein involved in polysaccharide export with SLBB domain|uniref:polysaccharide biosynthesis/export family protein n=1 Tax=Phenylobacterium sp. TaxID=1871053 RepID=UPI0030020143
MQRILSLLGLVAALIATSAVASAVQAQEPGAAIRAIPDYRLGSGDKIRVITFGEEALTGEFVVGGSGNVSMPLIGDVAAEGLTVPEFQTAVEESLKQGYLREPRVSVEVLNYRPFYIMGEVQNPGEYPYTNGLSVLNAVATAGGFTYRANSRRVYIKRADSSLEREYPLTPLTPVAPGDTIRITERFF